MSHGMNDLLSVLSIPLSPEELQLSALTGIICGEIVSQRLNRNMTQKQFAEFMGVSQGMVSKWESGDCNFTLQSLVHIAAKLDIPMQPPFVFERLAYTSRSKIVDFPGKWNSSSSITPTYLSAEDLMEN